MRVTAQIKKIKKSTEEIIKNLELMQPINIMDDDLRIFTQTFINKIEFSIENDLWNLKRLLRCFKEKKGDIE